MIFPWLRQKRIFQHHRLIIMSGLGVLFCLLLAYSIYQQYYKDTLLGYIPESSKIYLHLNRPTFKTRLSLDNLIFKLFNSFDIRDFKPAWIKREMAVMEKDNQFYLVVRTHSQQLVKRFLQENDVNHGWLDGSRVVIGEFPPDFHFDKHKIIVKQLNRSFRWPSDLKLYMNTGLINESQALDYQMIKQMLFNTSGHLYLSGRFKQDKLLVSINDTKAHDFDLPEMFEAYDFNLYSHRAEYLDPFLNQILAVSQDEYAVIQDYLTGWQTDFKLDLTSSLYKKLTQSKVLVLVQQATSTDDYLTDYRFHVNFELPQALDFEQIAQMEEILKNILAQKYPTPVKQSLTDGTIITELLPVTDEYTFVSQNGFETLIVQDQLLAYQVRDNHLAITNSRDLMANYNVAVAKDYLSLKTQLLPQTEVLDWLKAFETIALENNSLVLE